MDIREATEGDCADLAEIHLASWKAAYEGIFPEHVLDSWTVSRFGVVWKQNFSNQKRINLLAEEEGRPVGFISVGPCRDGDVDAQTTGEVYGLYLLPKAWGEGVAGKLLKEGLSLLCAKGFSEATLWVLRENSRARSFYEKSGFEPDGASKSFARSAESDLDEIRYRLRLSIHA